MTKDEMKNKISMALKDPILQQRFEIICKENAELEQKNIEDINTLNKCVEYWKNKSELLEEMLNKAKEIIKGLMRFCRCFAQHHTEDIRYKEAEQFIKED